MLSASPIVTRAARQSKKAPQGSVLLHRGAFFAPPLWFHAMPRPIRFFFEISNFKFGIAASLSTVLPARGFRLADRRPGYPRARGIQGLRLVTNSLHAVPEGLIATVANLKNNLSYRQQRRKEFSNRNKNAMSPKPPFARSHGVDASLQLYFSASSPIRRQAW